MFDMSKLDDRCKRCASIGNSACFFENSKPNPDWCFVTAAVRMTHILKNRMNVKDSGDSDASRSRIEE